MLSFCTAPGVIPINAPARQGIACSTVVDCVNPQGTPGPDQCRRPCLLNTSLPFPPCLPLPFHRPFCSPPLRTHSVFMLTAPECFPIPAPTHTPVSTHLARSTHTTTTTITCLADVQTAQQYNPPCCADIHCSLQGLSQQAATRHPIPCPLPHHHQQQQAALPSRPQYPPTSYSPRHMTLAVQCSSRLHQATTPPLIWNPSVLLETPPSSSSSKLPQKLLPLLPRPAGSPAHQQQQHQDQQKWMAAVASSLSV